MSFNSTSIIPPWAYDYLADRRAERLAGIFRDTIRLSIGGACLRDDDGNYAPGAMPVPFGLPRDGKDVYWPAMVKGMRVMICYLQLPPNAMLPPHLAPSGTARWLFDEMSDAPQYAASLAERMIEADASGVCLAAYDLYDHVIDITPLLSPAGGWACGAPIINVLEARGGSAAMQ